MRRLVRLALLVLGLTAPVCAQTPSMYPLTGNLSGVAGAPGDLLQARLSLVNCGGGSPTVPGVTITVKNTALFTASSSGAITGAIWGNDAIQCNQTASTLYQVVYLRNSVPTGVPFYLRITQATDLATAIPTTVIPPTTPLAAGLQCPTGNVLVGVLSNFQPVCQFMSNGILYAAGIPPPAACTSTAQGTYYQTDAAPGANQWLCFHGAWTQQGITDPSAIHASPIGNQTITQPAGTTLTINNLKATNMTGSAISYALTNGQALADNAAGADVGAQINNAFALTAGTNVTAATGAVVNLTPNGHYSYFTTIVIPNNVTAPYITSPILDCHNATLTYTGSGEGVTILGENAYQSGEIRNCNFVFTNTAATFTFWSRIFFRVSRSTFALGLTGITWKNDLAHGGPGYFEENHWTDIQMNVPSGGCGMNFRQDPSIVGSGVGSFFYNFLEGFHFDLNNSNGLCFRAATAAPFVTMFGSNLQLHVNTGGTNDALIYLENNTTVSRGTVDISGENSGGASPNYDVYAAGANSYFDNFGKSYATGLQHGYVAAIPLSNIVFRGGVAPKTNDLGSGQATTTLSGEQGGTDSRRQCKNDVMNGNTVFMLASNGGVESDCYWEIAYRATGSSYPDVDVAGASGNPLTSIIFTEPLLHKVGIGPGFSEAVSLIGGVDVSKPLSVEEVRGTLSVRNPALQTVADGGAQGVRSVDNIGNILDYITSGTSGQPTKHYKLQFRDYFSFTTTTAFDCYSNTTATCDVKSLSVNGGTILTSLSPSALGASISTTAATTDAVTVTGMTASGHCSISSTNATAATNLSTTYVSAKAVNQITLTHTATAGMTYDLICTPY